MPEPLTVPKTFTVPKPFDFTRETREQLHSRRAGALPGSELDHRVLVELSRRDRPTWWGRKVPRISMLAAIIAAAAAVANLLWK